MRNGPYNWENDPDAIILVSTINKIHCVTLNDIITAYFQSANNINKKYFPKLLICNLLPLT